MLLPLLSFKLKEKHNKQFRYFSAFCSQKNQTIHPIRGEIAPSLSPHTSISHLYPDLQQTENCGQDVYSCFAAAAVHVQHLMWLLNEDRKLFQLLPSARFPNEIDLGNWFKSFSQSHATIHVRSERQFLFAERKTHYANPFTKPSPQGIFGRANAFLFSPPPFQTVINLCFFFAQTNACLRTNPPAPLRKSNHFWKFPISHIFANSYRFCSKLFCLCLLWLTAAQVHFQQRWDLISKNKKPHTGLIREQESRRQTDSALPL